MESSRYAPSSPLFHASQYAPFFQVNSNVIRENKMKSVFKISILFISLTSFLVFPHFSESTTSDDSKYFMEKVALINATMDTSSYVFEDLETDLRNEVKKHYNDFLIKQHEIGDNDLNNFVELFMKYIDLDLLKDQLRTDLVKEFTFEEIKYVHDWWKSELGQKVLLLEKKNRDYPSKESFEKLIKNLNQTHKGKQKLKTLEEIYTLTENCDNKTDTYLNFIKAVTELFDHHFDLNDKSFLDNYFLFLDNLRPKLIGIMNETDFQNSIYNHANLKQDDLDSIKMYYSNEIGKKFKDISEKAANNFLKTNFTRAVNDSYIK